MKLKESIFTDPVTFKSQMEACSKDQMILEPANAGNGGIVDLHLDFRIVDFVTFDDMITYLRGDIMDGSLAGSFGLAISVYLKWKFLIFTVRRLLISILSTAITPA